jgi:hypothetical protein
MRHLITMSRRTFALNTAAALGLVVLPGKRSYGVDGNLSMIVPQQLDVEREAIRLFGHPAVLASRRRIEQVFSADRNVPLDGQRALIPQAAAEHAFAAVLAAVTETATHPSIYWSFTHTHRVDGLEVPGSRCGIDNPDNLYRLASVDDRYHYRIIGRRAAVAPIDGGITVMPAQPGEKIMANSLGYLGYDSLKIDGDGQFEITLDASAANGRSNHLSIAEGRVLIFRDTHGDWLTETPHKLSIECLDGGPVPHRSDDDIAARAATYGETMATYFLEHLEHAFFERRAPNSITPPTPSGANGGLVTQIAAQGWYKLAADEAMIVDVDLMGAQYFGFQLCDLWMLSYDYTQHLSGLNHLEAQPDHDGRVRFVISGVDPGVYNWLDAAGHLAGTTTLRWQRVANGRAPDANTVTSRIVKLGDVTKGLPKETRLADAQIRADQRKKRNRGWKRRIRLIYG